MKTAIGGLWIRDMKMGRKYLSGYIEKDGKRIDVVVFKNDFKKGKAPDYRILPAMARGE